MRKMFAIIDEPDNCSTCPFCHMKHPDKFECAKSKKEIVEVKPGRRQDWCELRFVPRKRYSSYYGQCLVETSENRIVNSWLEDVFGKENVLA